MADNQDALSRLAELMRRVNSTTDTYDVLQEIAGGVKDVLGYGVVAIARLEGDFLVMSNVVGPPEVVAEILPHRTPASNILHQYREADKWGILRFVPPGRVEDVVTQAAYIPDFEPEQHPDAWHPETALFAPLYSAHGELLGNMSVDLPADGRIPSPPDRELLEMFAVQAGVALSNARERERLNERVRLDAMLKTVAGAGTQRSLAQTLATSVVAVAECFGTVQTWVRCFPTEVTGPAHEAGTPTPCMPDQDIESLRDDLLAAGPSLNPIRLDSTDESSVGLARSREPLQRVMSRLGAARVVVCPILSHSELVGYVVLAFPPSVPKLSLGDTDALVEVTRLLGQIVRQARVLETEQRLVQELRELARYRSELIATISHELKTPLTAILGHAELLADRLPDVGSLDAIIRNAQRLNHLVSNLLHYSRVQGRRQTVRRAVDLGDLCAASVDLLGMLARQSGVRLSFEPPEHPVIVFGDAEELGRVIDNMVDNAVKYTRAEGDVVVRMSVDSERVNVEVADTGIGLSPVDQTSVFSAFHRSTNPTALSMPGTGLGLPIARRIAESHGGSLELVSELGAGSTFRFSLPLRSPPELLTGQ